MEEANIKDYQDNTEAPRKNGLQAHFTAVTKFMGSTVFF
jgi:hypothetical protein